MRRLCNAHIIWGLRSVQVCASWKAHPKNVRCLDYDPELNVLLTGSFDKTVKVYGEQA